MTPALTRNKPLTTGTDTGNVTVTHLLTSLAIDTPCRGSARETGLGG